MAEQPPTSSTTSSGSESISVSSEEQTNKVDVFNMGMLSLNLETPDLLHAFDDLKVDSETDIENILSIVDKNKLSTLLERLMVQNNLHQFDGSSEVEEEMMSVTLAQNGSSIIDFCNCNHAKSIWCSQNENLVKLLSRIYNERRDELPPGSDSVVASMISFHKYGSSADLACPNCVCSLQNYNINNTLEDLQEQLLDAIRHRDIRIVEDLVKRRGLSPNFEFNKKNPICRAVSLGDTTIITALLEGGADLDTSSHADMMWDRRPVHIAACKGDMASLQLLVRLGADINMQDSDHRTPLHWAAMYGHAHLLPWMLEAGAEVSASQTDGFTPLHTATCLGHAQVCQELLKGGASLSCRDKDGWTPLHTAVCYGNVAVLKLLFSQPQAPVHLTTNNLDSLLHIACSKGRMEVIDVVLRQGLPLERRNVSGATALHHAVLCCRVNAVFCLIKCGADVNALNNEDMSPAHIAAVKGDMQILGLLLAAGSVLPQATWQPLSRVMPSLAAQMEAHQAGVATLHTLAMLAVRRGLAPNLQSNVRHLPIPNSVKRALAMDDLSFLVSDGNGGHLRATMQPCTATDPPTFFNDLVFQRIEYDPS